MTNLHIDGLELVEMTNDEAREIAGGWFGTKTMEDLAYWAYYSRRWS